MFRFLSKQKYEIIKQNSSPVISIILTNKNIFPLLSVGVISVTIVTESGEIKPTNIPKSNLIIIKNI